MTPPIKKKMTRMMSPKIKRSLTDVANHPTGIKSMSTMTSFFSNDVTRRLRLPPAPSQPPNPRSISTAMSVFPRFSARHVARPQPCGPSSKQGTRTNIEGKIKKKKGKRGKTEGKPRKNRPDNIATIPPCYGELPA